MPTELRISQHTLAAVLGVKPPRIRERINAGQLPDCRRTGFTLVEARAACDLARDPKAARKKLEEIIFAAECEIEAEKLLKRIVKK